MAAKDAQSLPDGDEVSDSPLLTFRERIGAWVAGLLLGGGGATAVFLTSNQAGSTALILVGAVFLLIAVQGTPLLKATKDSIELRGKRVVARAKQIAADDSPEEAQKFLEGAASAEPRLSSSLVGFNAKLYESEMKRSLALIAGRKGWRLTSQVDGGYGVDFTLFAGEENDSAKILIVVKYSQSGLMSYGFFRKIFSLSNAWASPVLMVANAPGPGSLPAELDRNKFGYVEYHGSYNLSELEREASRLMSHA